MSTKLRKARKREGRPFVRAVKEGTPPLERSSTWRERDRWDKTKKRYVNEARPSREAVARGYVRDLGWQKPGRYIKADGSLKKEARP